jgi:AcrR family transcriptional regulator
MQAVSTRTGGRPAQVVVGDIVRAGRELGMARLSINAVAAKLGVSATALYRHISGRWELERLVGESLLGELELHDEPDAGAERHLVAFGLQLRTFVLDRPGLAGYLQTLFPRGDAGARLLADEVAALGRRGYPVEAAMVLSSAIATLAIGLAAQEETTAAADGEDAAGFATERDAAAGRLAGDEQLGEARSAIPEISSAHYVQMLLTASVRGLLGAIVPGRSLRDSVADLITIGEDH